MKNESIYFDSKDWNTIRDTIDKINEIGCIQSGETEDGEFITFNVGCDESGNDFLITDVVQSNGWIRTNRYYPNDYTVEERYHKE